MDLRLAVRLGLGYLALVSAQIGAWALAAPQGFYDDFPGLGRAWIASDGPFNEHLIRDVGALSLALFTLLAAAAIRLSRDLVVTAGMASLVWGVPHALYHATNPGTLGTADQLASMGGLMAFVAFAALVVVSGRRLAVAS